MNNKDRTIKAVGKLIKDRYTEYLFISCPLCKIFKWPRSPKSTCIGCPNIISIEQEDLECFCTTKLPVFKKWSSVMLYQDTTPKYSALRKAQWERALPILKKLPSSRFTVAGFIGFPELAFMLEKI